MSRRELPETTGVLAERKTASGARRIQLTQQERTGFQNNEMIERAVALYLDVERRHRTAEIAEELGITVHSLNNLIRSEEFERVYNEHFVELGHDPRLQATRSAMVDLLPDSMAALKDVLTGNSNAAKVQAVKLVWDYVGLTKPDIPDSDRKEAIEFLKNAGLNVENVNINLPAEYGQAMEGYTRAIDGEFREVSDVGTSEDPIDTVDEIE